MEDNPVNMEQELAKLRDGLPPIWWAIYTGCLEQGFDRDQSLRLVVAFVQRPIPSV